MFIITLVLSNFEGHRDVGLALLRGLPPYQVVRVLDFIHGRKATRKVRRAAQRPRKARPAGTKAAKADEPAKTVVEDFGLFRNPPRACGPRSRATCASARPTPSGSTAACWSRARRSSGCTRSLHVAPGERAQKILFDEDPPADSRLFALQELSRADDSRRAGPRDHRRTAFRTAWRPRSSSR